MDQVIQFAGNHVFLVTAWLFVATLLVVNITQTGFAAPISPQQAVLEINRAEGVAVDIRPTDDFDKTHITGAINVPANEIEQHIKKLEKYKDKPVVLYCDQGASSGSVVRQLTNLGFSQVNSLKGGLAAWRAESLPVSRTKKGKK